MTTQGPSKVFCIGMNRSGTTSLYEFLTTSGYHTTHDSHWWYWRFKSGMDQFEAFTDGFEGYKPWRVYPNLHLLLRWYPDAKFIANTRPLDAWLASRLKHNSPSYKKWKRKTDPESLIRGWIKSRNHWHRTILRVFRNRPESCYWMNIHQPEETDGLSDFLGFETKRPFPHSNQIQDKSQTNDVVQAFLDTFIEPSDHTNTRVAEWKAR